MFKYVTILLLALVLTACESEAALVLRIHNETSTAEAIIELTQGPIRATEQAQAIASAEALVSLEAQQTQMALDQASTQQAHNAQSTANAGAMLADLQALEEEGRIESISGHYIQLDDFIKSAAMINYFDFFETNNRSTNFALRAHMLLESAGTRGNAFTSGCGFVFRLQDFGNFYLIYQGMDGNVWFFRELNDQLTHVAHRYVGQVGFPRAEMDILFIVQGPTFQWFVDGSYIGQFYEPVFEDGELFYSLVSGTNEGFGTRCTLTDVDLWEFD